MTARNKRKGCAELILCILHAHSVKFWMNWTKRARYTARMWYGWWFGWNGIRSVDSENSVYENI